MIPAPDKFKSKSFSIDNLTNEDNIFLCQQHLLYMHTRGVFINSKSVNGLP